MLCAAGVDAFGATMRDLVMPTLSSFLLNQVGLLLIIVRTGDSTAGHYLELFGCCAKLIPQKIRLELHHFAMPTDLLAEFMNDEIALSAWSTLFCANSLTCGGTSNFNFGSIMGVSSGLGW